MADRNRKAQLGARVPHDVLDLADRAASAAQVSRNEWVEQAIVEKAERQGLRLGANVIDGQITIEESAGEPAPTGVAGRADSGEPSPAPADEPRRTLKAFDPACRNRSYHWKQGPGNPCRFCGGEA